MYLDVEKIRRDFPILKNQKIVYLDSASTTLKPKQVILEIMDYYQDYSANIHRGIYRISEIATEKYENARAKIAKFINAKEPSEIVFVRSATEGINLVARSFTKSLKEDDEIIITELEHHSNLVSWQQIAKEKNLKLKYIPVLEDGTLNLKKLPELLTSKTKILAITAVSNALGTIVPLDKIIPLVHRNKTLVLVDAAQAVPHQKIDVQKLNADFLVFSGHKMLGPTGIGVLYGKKEQLEKLPPYQFGGDMILEVGFKESRFQNLPYKFEAGTPNIAGTIGLGAAIDYLNLVGMENIRLHERSLTKYALKRLSEIAEISLYGPGGQNQAGIVSFNLTDIHPHDLAEFLDEDGIAIRAGHHCAQPLLRKLKINYSTRVSFCLYNTKSEIDQLVDALLKIKDHEFLKHQ